MPPVRVVNLFYSLRFAGRSVNHLARHGRRTSPCHNFFPFRAIEHFASVRIRKPNPFTITVIRILHRADKQALVKLTSARSVPLHPRSKLIRILRQIFDVHRPVFEPAIELVERVLRHLRILVCTNQQILISNRANILFRLNIFHTHHRAEARHLRRPEHRIKRQLFNFLFSRAGQARRISQLVFPGFFPVEEVWVVLHVRRQLIDMHLAHRNRFAVLVVHRHRLACIINFRRGIVTVFIIITEFVQVFNRKFLNAHFFPVASVGFTAAVVSLSQLTRARGAVNFNIFRRQTIVIKDNIGFLPTIFILVQGCRALDSFST